LTETTRTVKLFGCPHQRVITALKGISPTSCGQPRQMCP